MCAQTEDESLERTGEALLAAAEREIPPVLWQDTPLRDGLQRLGRSREVLIWLDRRVDPNQTVTATTRPQSLLETVRELARAAGADACLVDPVIYVGPPATTAVLATISQMQCEAAKQAPRETAAHLQEETVLQWPMLAEPAGLLTTVAAQSGLTWRDSPAPHDLWPAGRLPKTPRCRQLTLLLAGFGLTYRLDQPVLSTQPLPQHATLQANYPLPAAKAARLQELETQLAGSRTAVRNGRLWIDGPWEDHLVAQRWVGGRRAKSRTTRPSGKPIATYDLRTVETAGRLIQAIGQRLQITVRIDPACGERLDQRVDLQTEGATRDELIQAILEPAGLAPRWEGNVLIVVPK